MKSPEPTPLSNRPLCPLSKTPDPKKQNGFHEVWYLKLNDVASGRALWLRLTLLLSRNGFRQVAETWAIFFQRKETLEITKVAVKQTHDLSAFSAVLKPPAETIQIAGCELSDRQTCGTVQSKGQSIQWNFKITPKISAQFNLVPPLLSQAGIVKNTALTVGEDLLFNGTCVINGETFTWKDAPGMQAHLAGPRNGHSWVWGHCNTFIGEEGQIAPVIFEGLTAKALLRGGISSPKMSTFYFHYRGKEYSFNTLWHAIRSQSHHSLTDWQFIAEENDLSFRGHVQAELRNFAGVTYEDTDGSFLFCANSKLSDMTLLVYRNEKLEARFQARGTAAFEVVTRQKNPYVPILL